MSIPERPASGTVPGEASMPAEPKWWMPGPWSPSSVGVQDANGETVCEFFGPCQAINEDLIVAAPELYEALECLMSLCPWCEPGKPCKHTGHAAALAALAKARNEPTPVKRARPTSSI